MATSPNAKRDEILGADVVISVPGLDSVPEDAPDNSTNVPDVKPAPRIDQSIFDMPLAASRTVTNVAQQTIIAGSENAHKSNEGLKSNMVALGLVLSYVGVSILVFHFVEHWSVVDCVYYAMVIVTTVGYGDVVPITTAGKAFTIFFAFYGICTIGVALGQLASWFLQRQKHVTKMATQKLMNNVENAAATATGSVQDKEAKLRKMNKAKTYWKRFQGSLPGWARKIFSDSNKALFHAFVPIVVSILAGLIVGTIEGWPVLDCFYYTLVTITTVGFGDLSPKSQGARVYAIFYLPLAVVTVAHGVGSILNELSARSVMKTKISMKELLDMDADGDGKVSQLEYLSYMLVKLNKADQDDIDGIIAQFHKLDRDGSGELDRDDLERLDRELQRQNEEDAS
ncbi:Potassium channel [Phytophthora pseudosyringae]|uniref:Potassium channel n=1 Tax=Phytophthora pseudosyringae TaxID=221518 RepID=A0A8T1WE70_9STRA|nr:Potassium channel [Phytophthora pseudosyringae]